MCGYCCGGVPIEKRGQGHAKCSTECYNAPTPSQTKARLAEAWDEGARAATMDYGIGEVVKPYR